MIRTRDDLAKHFAELGYKTGAEIGVENGAYGVTLCQSIPGLKYYGVDSWTVGGRRKHIHNGQYKQTVENLAPYDATLIRKLSMEGVKDFDDDSLDFVYIDANHKFDYVVNDVIEWTKKVRKGGIVAGHDYQVPCGVVPAVDGYIKAHSLRLNLTTDSSEQISWWFLKKWNT